MVVQPRGDRLWLFQQHDHALASGELARAWETGGASALSHDTLVAIGMHDVGWIDVDATPTLDSATGLPYDFIRTPLDRRLAIYRRSIDEAERVSPRAGLLVSIHFGGFVSPNDAPDFCVNERRRQERLRLALGTDTETIDRDYAVLKALDHLSLIACVATPGSDAEWHPRWAGQEACLAGVPTRISWCAERTIALDPTPLRGPCTAGIPYREIALDDLSDDESLQAAIESPTTRTLEVTFTSG